jgi:S-(hydroxymethyl)glutathione dehydrogenase/alcohol dehydrogenase
LYLQKRLDLDQLVSRTYALEQVNEAYADMLAGLVARGVIMFE